MVSDFYFRFILLSNILEGQYRKTFHLTLGESRVDLAEENLDVDAEFFAHPIGAVRSYKGNHKASLKGNLNKGPVQNNQSRHPKLIRLSSMPSG